MKCALILVCAGRGRRLKKKTDKSFVRLGKFPLFYYSYSVFRNIKYFSQIIIVSRKKYFPLIKRYTKDRRVFLTTGGLRRQDSVYKGLLLVKEDIDYVFIHDGARPFINRAMIGRLKKKVFKYKAVVVGLRINDAVKVVERNIIKHSLERKNLWYIQTPQVFERKLLSKAYNKFRKFFVYDDSEFIVKLSQPVKVIEGEFWNIKVTYPQDLVLARAILKMKKVSS